MKNQIEALAGRESGYPVHVFLYSDADDFKALWGLDADGEDAALADRLCGWGCPECWKGWQPDVPGATLAVVWDGSMPDRDPAQLDAGEFTSPYDWAQFASHCIYTNERLKHCRLRMLILDIRGDRKPETGVDPLNADHNALPWVQDYVPIGRAAAVDDLRKLAESDQFARVRQVLPLAARNHEVFLEDLMDPRRVLTTNDVADIRVQRRAAIKDLMVPWQNNLEKRENRHSVANLIGPVLLSAVLPRETAKHLQSLITGVSLGRRALVVALKQVGLMPLPKSPFSMQRYPGFIEKRRSMVKLCQHDIFRRLRQIRFRLVDDQIDLGYDHFLASVVLGHDYECHEIRGDVSKFSNDNHSLVCEPTIDGLLDDLLKHRGGGPIKNLDEPRIFDKADVLLLDLRLWPTDGKRQDVLEKLVSATEQMLGTTLPRNVDKDLATALEVARSAVSERREGFDYAYLALLPLLLTCFDRTLPIIIFSSTQQRRVAELLGGRPNIFVCFAKPMSGTAADNTLGQLVQSLCLAVNLHELRAVWSRAAGLQPESKEFDYEDDWTETDGTRTVDFGAEKNAVEVRTRIGQMFTWCIDDRPLFPEIDKPWDLLEEFAQRPPMHPNARLSGFDKDCDFRSRVARALKVNRNARVHGKLESRRFDSTHRRRQVLALQLLFLIEYLGPPPDQGRHSVEMPTIGPRPNRNQVAEYIVWNLIREVSAGGLGWRLAPLSEDVLEATSRIWHALRGKSLSR